MEYAKTASREAFAQAEAGNFAAPSDAICKPHFVVPVPSSYAKKHRTLDSNSEKKPLSSSPSDTLSPAVDSPKKNCLFCNTDHIIECSSFAKVPDGERHDLT